MSHELNLAIVLPGQPFIFAALALPVVVIIAIIVIRKSRRTKATMATWAAASDALGLQFVVNGTGIGPIARGRVNDHVASITPVQKGPKVQSGETHRQQHACHRHRKPKI